MSRNEAILLRLPAELLERIDAQGRPRQDLIRAAIEYYLYVRSKGDTPCDLTPTGNVTHVPLPESR
jgi:hypothetical protein